MEPKIKNVIEKVQGIVARRLGIDAAHVSGMLFLDDDYGATPGDVAEIIAEVERDFGIRLHRNKCCVVVGDITSMVVQALCKKRSRESGNKIEGTNQ